METHRFTDCSILKLPMKKSSLLIGLTAVLFGACAQQIPPSDFRQPDTESGSAVLEDAPNETTPKTIDSLEATEVITVPDVRGESGAIVMGNSDAKLQLRMYDDYGCFYCREFASLDLPWLLSRYVAEKKLSIERVLVPKSPEGVLMAKIAICSEEQGLFLKTDTELHVSPITSEKQIPGLAKAVGLNLKDLQTCLASPSTTAALAFSGDRAQKAGVTRIPAFELGTDRWIGILTREELEKKIGKAR